MPYHAYLLELFIGPEAVQIVFVKEGDERLEMVLVDGFEGLVGAWVPVTGEVVVGETPLPGEVTPVDCRGGGTNGGGDRGA